MALDAAAGGIGRLFEKHHRRLIGYVGRIVGDVETARDITQDAFVSACRVYESQPEWTLTKAWLYRTATNGAISFLRKKKRVKLFSLFDEEARSGMLPDEIVADRVDVRTALAALRVDQRSAVLLCIYYGLPSKEAAALLNTSPEAVRQRLCRALKKLKTNGALCASRYS